MIVLLFAKAIFFMTTLLDFLIKAVTTPFGVGADLISAIASILGVMGKVSLYLFAMWPQTVGMIYGWVFVYFSVWLLYHFAGIISSFIPRHNVVR